MAKIQMRRKFSLKIFIFFILFEVVFTGITAPLVIFYGPFKTLKKYVVTTAMATMHARIIPEIFLSQKEIDEIINTATQASAAAYSDSSQNSQDQDMDAIKIAKSNDIEMLKVDGGRYKGYILIVHDPTKVKVGITKYKGVKGQRTSEIAQEHGAVAAINGGGFTDKSSSGTFWTGSGGLPTGIVMSSGQVSYKDIEDDTRQCVAAITKTGKLVVGKHSIDDLKSMGVEEALSFQIESGDTPTLVVNGKMQSLTDTGLQPRTAIGQRRDGAIMLMAVDGRQLNMLGASREDVAKVMIQNGAYNVEELDGGSSTTMYYDGDVVNNPCNPFGERTVATAIYVEP